MAFDAVASLPIASTGFKAKLLRSLNVADDDMDYVPNDFEDSLTDQSPREQQSPPPRWFVAYYRDGRGNFIHAARYLAKEIGKIPDENIKKYGKGVLVRAKDTTQSMMLDHLPCPSDSMFENVKAHHSFNYSKGCVYNHDLYEFSEEDILQMCPSSVQRVTKMRGTSNMILLTFFGSIVPDRVRIGPLNLAVKRFVDRPLQCFSCYGYGHGKKNCTETPRCGNCSALNSHSTAECEENSYCYYCKDAHQLSSRHCPRYRLEQDIVQLANTQFISLGSARRELLYRQKAGNGAMTYSTSLGSRSVAQSTDRKSSMTAPARSSEAFVNSNASQNRFSVLSDDSVESTPEPEETSLTSSTVIHVAEIHAPHTESPKSWSPRRRTSNRAAPKRHHSSADSVESLIVPPAKVSAGSPSRVRSPERASSSSAADSGRSLVSPVTEVPSAISAPFPPKVAFVHRVERSSLSGDPDNSEMTGVASQKNTVGRDGPRRDANPRDRCSANASAHVRGINLPDRRNHGPKGAPTRSTSHNPASLQKKPSGIPKASSKDKGGSLNRSFLPRPSK